MLLQAMGGLGGQLVTGQPIVQISLGCLPPPACLQQHSAIGYPA